MGLFLPHVSIRGADMEINANFAEPAFVNTSELNWVASPMAGVDRRMLDRIGGEVARATSIVRYAQGSAFPEHTHSGGEEFIVLEGVFQDEHGDYPAGSYVRNPVGTHHIPRSEPGCTIFVKLWQFDPEDQEQYALDLNTIDLADDPDTPGLRTAVLAERDYEQVALEHWKPGLSRIMSASGGIEILVLSGAIELEGQIFAEQDWIRLPSAMAAHFSAKGEGAKLWIKRGHLENIRLPSSA